MKFRGRAWVLVLVMLFALGTAALAAEKGFLWDGTQWKDMTTRHQSGLCQGDRQHGGFRNRGGGSGPAPCISKGFVDELKTKTIAQVIAEVDKFYKENPAKLDLPVVAVILQRCTKLCAPAAEKK